MNRDPFTIVIQARTGSTRLPGKMSLPFHDGATILELIIDELLSRFAGETILVATSTASADDVIQDIAKRAAVRYSRGSERDVLGRFVHAVADDKVDHVVRICADNPFMRAAFVEELLAAGQEDSVDYISFALPDGTPTILSHLGLFAEVIRKQTLREIAAIATSPRHREHPTSYILDDPDQYARRYLPVPLYVIEIPSVRLTVDTESDFATCQQLYSSVRNRFGARFTSEQLFSFLRDQPDLHERMAKEILANEKR